MQHVEQFDEERHLLNRAALDQRQDELALLQADEVIGVFTTGSDALIVKQTAEPVRGEKCFQLGPSQWGKTDISGLPTIEVNVGCYQLNISHCGISMSGWSERMKLGLVPSARTRK